MKGLEREDKEEIDCRVDCWKYGNDEKRKRIIRFWWKNLLVLHH